MTISPGIRIRELRQLYNMSQEELGKKVGVQRAAIQKYEKGTVENIPLTTIEKIANVFDVSPTYLVGWNVFEGNELSIEITIIKGIQHFYGNDVIDLLEAYIKLNTIGKKRVNQYIDDMAMLYTDDHTES